MFTLRGLPALIGALCMLASAGAHAAGEFEARLRKEYADSFKRAFITAGGDEQEASQRADVAAECFMRSVMQEFRFDEVARLDAWATDGAPPGKDIEHRLHRRMMDTVLKDACNSSAKVAPTQ